MKDIYRTCALWLEMMLRILLARAKDVLGLLLEGCPRGAGDHRCLNGVVFADCWSWAWNLEGALRGCRFLKGIAYLLIVSLGVPWRYFAVSKQMARIPIRFFHIKASGVEQLKFLMIQPFFPSAWPLRVCEEPGGRSAGCFLSACARLQGLFHDTTRTLTKTLDCPGPLYFWTYVFYGTTLAENFQDRIFATMPLIALLSWWGK